MSDSDFGDQFSAALASELNRLVVVSADLSYDVFEKKCREVRATLMPEAGGRCDLELELERRLQERRLGYWLDRAGHAMKVKEQLLARCALGFEAPWHEGQVFLRAIQYLLVEPANEEAKILAQFITTRISCEEKLNPSPLLKSLLENCIRLSEGNS